METIMSVIIIISGPPVANLPDPPTLNRATVLSSAAQAMRELRNFVDYQHLTKAQQIEAWRHNADVIRASRRPVAAPSRSWPTDGDAA
jgi:hypothetical protein